MQKIFLVEDDEDIRELAEYALQSAGFLAYGFEDAEEFFQKLNETIPDLVLLDIMLPKEDGLTILKRLQGIKKYRNIPVVFLTARGNELDRVRGLDLGADDYIVKPFSVLELISRIKAVLRRTDKKSTENSILEFGGICLDVNKYNVSVDGCEVKLTLKEFELLHYLLINTNIVLSRDKIIDKLWGYDYDSESRTVDMHIKSLRQKLCSKSDLIKTIRGIGYKIGE